MSAEMQALYERFPDSSAQRGTEKIRLGIWWHQWGRGRQAEDALREGIEAWRASDAPRGETYLNGLMTLHRIVRDRSAAREEARRLLDETLAEGREVWGEGSPELTAHLLAQAEHLDLQGRTAEALPLVLRALEIHGRGQDDDADLERHRTLLVRLVRAVALRPGATPESLRTASAAVELLIAQGPEGIEHFYLLQGLLHYRLGNPGGAVESLEAAVGLRPESEQHPMDHAVLAMARMRLGQIPKALDSLRRAKTLALRTRYDGDGDVTALVREAAAEVGQER